MSRDSVWALILGGFVRMLLAAVGGRLLAWKVIDQELYGRFLSEGTAQLLGYALLGVALIWSARNKIWGWIKLRVAHQTPPSVPLAVVKQEVAQIPLGEKLSVLAGKDVAVTRTLGALLIPALLISAISLQGCDDKKAARQFAVNTDRVAGYVNSGLKATDDFFTRKLITAPQATALTNGLRQVNAVNGQLVAEAKQYIVVIDGKEQLQFTEQGKADLARLAESLRSVAAGLINDPVISGAPPEVKAKLTTLTNGLAAAVQALIGVIQSIKPAPKQAVTKGDVRWTRLPSYSPRFSC